ncbi:MAG: anhydro-N-acetylmuramic acid kinase [Chitinispirillaceae bacterium]|nr:anhydro-N-acetylmuramic acid kinase [Chitinispirillaceae bacterium]
MIISPYRTYKKLKQRRLLVVSAAGESSGVQGLYFICHDDTWEIIAHAFLPYGEKTGAVIESSRRSSMTLADLSWLESRVTLLIAECAKTVMAQVPRGLKKKHLVVLNELSLFRGPTGETGQFTNWNTRIGDPQYLATVMNAPVLSDLSRHHLLAGGNGAAPTIAGDLVMARRLSGIVAFLNIGLVSRLTVVNPRSPQRCIIDSDTGPGMCLINRTAREIGCPNGFDRDGSQAAKGTVNAATLDLLATSPWFLKDGPKEAAADQFDSLLQKAAPGTLAPADQLATITALTARTVYDFFQRAWREPEAPGMMVVSGGGANNLALTNYLSAYFPHIPVTSCEKLAIPPEMRVPLAIGLSADAFLREEATVWEDGILPRPGLLGRVSVP